FKIRRLPFHSSFRKKPAGVSTLPKRLPGLVGPVPPPLWIGNYFIEYHLTNFFQIRQTLLDIDIIRHGYFNQRTQDVFGTFGFYNHSSHGTCIDSFYSEPQSGGEHYENFCKERRNDKKGLEV